MLNYLQNFYWRVLFLGMVVFLAWLSFDYSQGKKNWRKAREQMSGEIRSMQDLRGAEMDRAAWEGRYWKLMGYASEMRKAVASDLRVYDFEENRVTKDAAGWQPLEQLIRGACEELGYGRGDGMVELIARTIIENLRTLHELKVLQDPENISQMSRGQAPAIPTGSFEEEEMRIVPRIPAAYLPGAYHSYLNVRLVPRTAALVFTPELDEDASGFATLLANARIISKEEHRELTNRVRKLEAAPN